MSPDKRIHVPDLRAGLCKLTACESKRRGWLAPQRLGVSGFQSIRNAQEQNARLFGLTVWPNPEPARFSRGEDIQRYTRFTGRSEQSAKVTSRVQLNSLNFLPDDILAIVVDRKS